MKYMQIGEFQKLNKNLLWVLGDEPLLIYAHSRPLFIVQDAQEIFHQKGGDLLTCEYFKRRREELLEDSPALQPANAKSASE